VKVELKDARDDGRRRLNGRLAGVETGEVLVNVDGEICDWRCGTSPWRGLLRSLKVSVIEL